MTHMPALQILAAYIAIGGDRDQVVFRGPDNPITYPEMIVLSNIHGGTQSVSDAHVLRVEDTDMATERDRLRRQYGAKIVDRLFPAAMPLPFGDEALPTVEEVEAAEKAAAEALAEAKSKRGKKPKAAPAETQKAAPAETPKAPEPTVPDLNKLPE